MCIFHTVQLSDVSNFKTQPPLKEDTREVEDKCERFRITRRVSAVEEEMEVMVLRLRETRQSLKVNLTVETTIFVMVCKFIFQRVEHENKQLKIQLCQCQAEMSLKRIEVLVLLNQSFSMFG